LDEAAWLRRRQAMGIERLDERDTARISAAAPEREGRETSNDPQGIGGGDPVIRLFVDLSTAV